MTAPEKETIQRRLMPSSNLQVKLVAKVHNPPRLRDLLHPKSTTLIPLVLINNFFSSGSTHSSPPPPTPHPHPPTPTKYNSSLHLVKYNQEVQCFMQTYLFLKLLRLVNKRYPMLIVSSNCKFLCFGVNKNQLTEVGF